MIGDKPFRIKRYGRKLTLEISFNNEENAAKMYHQMLEMAATGKEIKLTIKGTGLNSMDA